VDSNTALPKVQKLQYLKSQLKGEALDLIRYFQITEENYETAFKELKGIQTSMGLFDFMRAYIMYRQNRCYLKLTVIAFFLF
jgi:hypothetical protein